MSAQTIAQVRVETKEKRGFVENMAPENVEFLAEQRSQREIQCTHNKVLLCVHDGARVSNGICVVVWKITEEREVFVQPVSRQIRYLLEFICCSAYEGEALVSWLM